MWLLFCLDKLSHFWIYLCVGKSVQTADITDLADLAVHQKGECLSHGPDHLYNPFAQKSLLPTLTCLLLPRLPAHQYQPPSLMHPLFSLSHALACHSLPLPSLPQSGQSSSLFFCPLHILPPFVVSLCFCFFAEPVCSNFLKFTQNLNCCLFLQKLFFPFTLFFGFV